MTITADWGWWTYFRVGREIVSRGRILEYDVGRRWLRYLKESGRDWADNPHPLGTAEYQAWNYDTVEATYDELWVDPDRSLIPPREATDAMERGERPSRFVALTDTDPASYFQGQTSVVSTYLPP
jgi:hypothetical protein